MPEERNRVITDHLSTLLLTHSDDANKNLNAEALTARISFVGNTMIDTLRANEDDALALEAWREFGLEPGGYVLVTLHRPSLVDVPDLLARTVAALDDVAETLPVIFPVHPRTRRNLEGSTRVLLTEPLPYRQFLSLEAKAAAVVTDSGGIQEETTVLARSLLHAARQHRAAGHDRARHEHAARARAGTLARGTRSADRSKARADPAALGRACGRTGSRGDRTPRGWSHRLKVWVDMTASAHVLVFRPLIRLLRERGDEVEITARDYAQTLQLLELHGLEATVIGRHGGRSRLGKARSLTSRLRALRKWATAARVRHRARTRVARADDDGAPARNPERDDARLRVRDAAAPARHASGDEGGRAGVDPRGPARASGRATTEAAALPRAEGGVLPLRLRAGPDGARDSGCRPRPRARRPAAPAGRLALPPAFESALPADARLPGQARRM